MKKVILVDGNNLMFRSYYATVYSGNTMKNSEGFSTNAIYGFVNMINKIINEEDPKYIAVAFDIGKTFRHDKYKAYKDGRIETPDDLKKQFPVAKQVLVAMGIKYFEIENYEADDIIGTFAKMVDENDEYIATIISSDRDLLQLISDDVEVKLLKQKDYIRMNKTTFYEMYGINPLRIVDLKGLQGDSSDNIPGVKGIGEKTALKLLQQYDTVEQIYENIDSITGSVKTKLINDKENAFMSKDIATIYRDVPLGVSLDSICYEKNENDELVKIYNNLGFYSLLKKIKVDGKNKVNEELEVKIVSSTDEIIVNGDVGIYLEIDNDNYHNANIIGMGVYNKEYSIYIPWKVLKEVTNQLDGVIKYTYDVKKLFVSLKKRDIVLSDVNFDTMTGAYLLNYTVKDDIAYLANELGYEIDFYNKKTFLTEEEIAFKTVMKAKFIYESKSILEEKLASEGIRDFYYDIEFPLSIVLGKMEYTGIRIDKTILLEMKEDLEKKIAIVSNEIYEYASEEFNINSPKQLGEILFDKLKLPYAKKNKTGYVTDSSILNKLKDYPIVLKILEYRMIVKLYNTYILGILNIVSTDDKIHTIYTQCLTRTGRLSSIEPNLQNIPIKNEYGKLIRKAFIPEDNSIIMSSDYSQIELRMFAHLSNSTDLIEAFNEGMDIHTHTAMDIFKVNEDEVTSNMRRKAKAVNFGILYGISSYGLSEDLDISMKDAKEFINKYFEIYPGIKEYMNLVIEEAHKKGYVKTIMNRKRIIDELNNTNYIVRSSGERMALNTPVQGSCADILKKAMVEIDRKFEQENIKSTMLLQVHDELIFSVLKEEKEKVEKIVTNIMENTYKISVPIIVDNEFGNNWYDAK